MKRTLGALALSLLLGLVGLYIVAGPEIFRAETYHVPRFDWWLIGIVALTFCSQWLIPTMRMQILCRDQGHRLPYVTAVLIHLVGIFSAAATPGGSGNAPALAAGLKRVNVPLGQGVALAVQIAVLDLLFFSWAVPVALAYLGVSGIIRLPLSLLVLVLASTLVALTGSIVIGRYPGLGVHFFLWLARMRALARFRRRLVQGARDYYRSARAFTRMSVGTWLYLQALGAVGWLSIFVMFWALLNLYESAEVAAIVATLTVATLVSFVVPTPGGSGMIEVAVGYGTSAQVSETALSAPLLLWRLLTFYVIFLLGPIASWLLFGGMAVHASPVEQPCATDGKRRD